MSVMAATLRRHADGTLTLITHAALSSNILLSWPSSEWATWKASLVQDLRSTRSDVTWMLKFTKNILRLQLLARTLKICLTQMQATRLLEQLLLPTSRGESSRPSDISLMQMSSRDCCCSRCAPKIRPLPRSLCLCQ